MTMMATERDRFCQQCSTGYLPPRNLSRRKAGLLLSAITNNFDEEPFKLTKGIQERSSQQQRIRQGQR